MKQITLTKVSARLIELNVSAKAEGFTTRDSRKWDRIATKILDAIADYDEPMQSLTEQAQAIADDDLTQEERVSEARRIGRESKELDATLGQETVTLVLESEEFEFVSTAWWESKVRADRASRKLTGAVSDALDAAADVKIEDGKVVPIGEQPRMLRAENRRQARGR